MSLTAAIIELIFVLRCTIPELVKKYKVAFPEVSFKTTYSDDVSLEVLHAQESGDTIFILTIKKLTKGE